MSAVRRAVRRADRCVATIARDFAGASREPNPTHDDRDIHKDFSRFVNVTRKPLAHHCSKDGDNQLPSSIGNESLPCRGRPGGQHVRRYSDYDLDRQCIRRICRCRNAVQALAEFCFVVSALRYAIPPAISSADLTAHELIAAKGNRSLPPAVELGPAYVDVAVLQSSSRAPILPTTKREIACSGLGQGVYTGM
jgi:hypothetical protein